MINRENIILSALLAGLLLVASQAAFAASDLTEVIAREASAALGTPVTVELRREFPAFDLPEAAELRLRYPKAAGQHLPTALEIQCNGQLLRAIPLGSYVNLKLRAATVPGGLQRGTLVQDGAVVLAELTLAPGQEVVTDPALVCGLAARSHFAPGERLKLSRLIAPPDAARGSNVTLLLTSGGIELTASAVLLADAYAGQPVRVRRTSDNSLWKGVLRCAETGLVVVAQ